MGERARAHRLGYGRAAERHVPSSPTGWASRSRSSVSATHAATRSSDGPRGCRSCWRWPPPRSIRSPWPTTPRCHRPRPRPPCSTRSRRRSRSSSPRPVSSPWRSRSSRPAWRAAPWIAGSAIRCSRGDSCASCAASGSSSLEPGAKASGIRCWIRSATRCWRRPTRRPSSPSTATPWRCSARSTGSSGRPKASRSGSSFVEVLDDEHENVLYVLDRAIDQRGRGRGAPPGDDLSPRTGGIRARCRRASIGCGAPLDLGTTPARETCDGLCALAEVACDIFRVAAMRDRWEYALTLAREGDVPNRLLAKVTLWTALSRGVAGDLDGWVELEHAGEPLTVDDPWMSVHLAQIRADARGGRRSTEGGSRGVAAMRRPLRGSR